jgi:hypothetical protein
MALHASRLSEEQERATLFTFVHGVFLAARVAIDGRVGKSQRELELGNGAAEHAEVEGLSLRDLGKAEPEQIAVNRICIETVENRLPNWVVAETARVGRRDW